MTEPQNNTLGIKQIIRLDWMEKAANLMLAGFDAKTLRGELHTFLYDKKAATKDEERGATSRSQVVNIIMNIWPTPNPAIAPLRNDALAIVRESSTTHLAAHWALISAQYPFWFNVARQVGRLLNLQEQITQAQIIRRVKEQYGDRETVSRYCRAVIRSMVAWDVIRDTGTKGCYRQGTPLVLTDHRIIALLVEASLHATSGNVCALRAILNDPAFFPFQFNSINGEAITRLNKRFELTRLGFDEEILKLKNADRKFEISTHL